LADVDGLVDLDILDFIHVNLIPPVPSLLMGSLFVFFLSEFRSAFRMSQVPV